jgi:hypothetical protein
MCRSASVFAAALFLAAVPLPSAAQVLGKCIAGMPVIDRDGRIGTIRETGPADRRCGPAAAAGARRTDRR